LDISVEKAKPEYQQFRNDNLSDFLDAAKRLIVTPTMHQKPIDQKYQSYEFGKQSSTTATGGST